MNDCKTDPHQPALFTSVRWPRAKTVKRDAVLTHLDKIINWPEIEAMVRPHYSADIQATGRKGYSLKMMLRCVILQYLWNLSDRQTEVEILDSHAMSRFVGTDPWKPRPPSYSKIREFRVTLMSWHCDPVSGARTLGEPRNYLCLHEAVVDAFLADLRRAGMEVRQGTVVDPQFRRLPPAAADLDIEDLGMEDLA